MNTKAESSETGVSEGAAMSMPAARESRAKADGDGDGDEHSNRAKRGVRVERRSRLTPAARRSHGRANSDGDELSSRVRRD